MKSFFSALFGAALALIGAGQIAKAADAAPDPNQGPIYVTTYYEEIGRAHV